MNFSADLEDIDILGITLYVLANAAAYLTLECDAELAAVEESELEEVKGTSCFPRCQMWIAFLSC